MGVADWRVKEDLVDARKNRVAEPAVRPRHRARLDAAQKAIADHQVVAVAQLRDQRGDGREVIAGVGVAHHDESSLRRIDAADEGAAVALALNLHHVRAELTRYQLRAVGAPVVGDDDLRGEPAFGDRVASLRDARGQRLDLVEAGHHERDLDRDRSRACGRLGGTLRDLHGARA